MEDMKWSSGGLLGVLAANNIGFGLALPELCQTFGKATVPRGHDMSKISLGEPSQHGNITHWTHMEDMKWSSSGLLGVLAANSLGFGLALPEICQTFAFGAATVPKGHDMPKINPTEPS